VTDWGPSTYGQPCRDCAFDWSVTLEDARARLATIPREYGEVLASAGATGTERHPALAWTVAGYVSHVADNLRIWTERLRGVASGATRQVGGYDENELAQARNYALIPIEAALWSLGLSVTEWGKAVDASRPAGVLMVHPERGELDLLAVVTSNTHDAHHHLWDVRRALGSGTGEG
jgi:hypothetical protein